MGLTLVLGGTRSGKSAFAESLARASGLAVRYVATTGVDDESMAERIAAHVARRPPEWETVVAGDVLTAALCDERCVLVDGLGGWIAGVMSRGATVTALARVATDETHRTGAPEPSRAHVLETAEAFARAASGATCPVIVVAEQAGEGLLALDSVAREWLDLLGEATQQLAAVAERAVLVVAGRAIELPATSAGSPGGAIELPPSSVGRPAPAGVAVPAGGGQDLRQHGDALVRPGDADHAVNVLAGGPPPWLREALRRALEKDVAAYPRESETLAALAALHGRAPAEIVPTNGAAQALWLLPAALRPRLAACVHPGFTESEAALRAHGVPVAQVLRDPNRGFALDPAAIPDGADLVVVGNPASPSGTLDPAAALLALRRRGRTIVVDEAFMDLVPGEPASLVREALPDVIVVRSLTKSLAIPGLRAGYAVAPAPLADRLRAVRPPWSCNALALAALRVTAQRPEALATAAARAQAERADLEERLAALSGVRMWPAAANYVLVRVRDGAAVTARLRAAGIAVRPAGSFPGLTADHLRITARGARDNERLAGALAEALAR